MRLWHYYGITASRSLVFRPYTYVVLIVHGRRTLEQVPAKLGKAAVIAEAQKRIGTDVNGILLTQEIFDEKFAD